MKPGTPTFTLRTPLLLREPDDVVADGCVVVHSGRVAYAGPWAPGHGEGPVTDLPETLITPGLVNAHTHLHLSYLAGRVPRSRSFVSWLMEMAPRVRLAPTSLHRESLRRGAEACLAAGVTTVGDVVNRWEVAPEHQRTSVRKVVFLELLGLSAKNAANAVRRTEGFLARLPAGETLTPALAPHAPYSVCPELYHAAASLASRLGCLLATHAAEAPAERELLQDGRGELAARLRLFGLLPRRWKPPGCSPIELLAREGLLEGPILLVHCNDLSAGDVDLLARSRCRVAYCPRSSHYFHTPDHPWQALRRRGVLVALGTDSLASTSSLSILDEMHFLARRHPPADPRELFAMGTMAGAEALGLAETVGALRPGSQADLVVWQLPRASPGDAVERLIWGRPPALATYVDGKLVWSLRDLPLHRPPRLRAPVPSLTPRP
jgi:cytosine/adenosine deaminase-related metal-dependent hydrolase